MDNRATVINFTTNRQMIVFGEPILDEQYGVLIIQFSDGSSRVVNWDHVTDYYYLTEEETASMVKEGQ